MYIGCIIGSYTDWFHVRHTCICMYINMGMCTGTQIDFICVRREEDALQELVSLVITLTFSAVFQGVNFNFACLFFGWFSILFYHPAISIIKKSTSASLVSTEPKVIEENIKNILILSEES